MRKNFIHDFLETFFRENNCHVDSMEGKLVVGLTEEMDKALMNRPFYWNYMETMNQKGKPMKLTFLTKNENRDEEGEWVTFGSPRLHQVAKHLKGQSQYTRLFQVMHTHEQTMLHPWLVLNYCVRYEGKQIKEKLFSIGLHLIKGTIVHDMMENLQQIELDEVISNHCYTISPIIKPSSGINRIEKYIDDFIENDDHTWAVKAHQRLQRELDLIQHFYEHTSDKQEKKREEIAAQKRFTPKITHEIISGGLFYLDTRFHFQ